MKGKSAVFAFHLALVTGIVGFILGSRLPIGGIDFLAKPQATTVSQSAPSLLALVDGSEFVDSDLEMEWRWNAGLAENQRFALRVWSGNLPHREIWTVEERVSVKDVIDSFSVDVGSFDWKVAVVNVADSGEFASMGSEWSEQYKLHRVRRLSFPAVAFADMSGIAQQIYAQDLDAGETIDAVHRFVQANSISDLQESYAADYGDAIELMFNHAQGVSSERPHLLCDGRSTAMLTVLKELGIESRLVFLYSPSPGYLSQHTALEVFNPERQRWQVHDLAWDFYYVDALTMDRVSAERILYGPRKSLAGCPIVGGLCRAEVMEDGIGYFDALRYGYTFEVWVNPDRFEISSRFEGQGGQNLAEFIGDGYPNRVTIRMDSWVRING